MISAAVSRVGRALSLSWLTGPIFAKELRVASRRRRMYLLRIGYLALLSLFMVLVWLATIESETGSNALATYRMSEAGKKIIGAIVWFQFIAIQLVAVIFLSSSISEEVAAGTLGILMTTPITSLQIIVGKLLSKLLGLMLLLAISLPILSVVRVFGGVPWEFVIAGSCITLTAALFAGSVAMFFSAIFRRTYVSILLTFAAGFVFYNVLPLIVGLALRAMSDTSLGKTAGTILLHVNPFFALFLCTLSLTNPGAGGLLPFYWPLHCLFMLAMSAGMLFFCVRVVRRVSVRKVFGPARKLKAVPVAAPVPPVAVRRAVPVAVPAGHAATAPPPLPGASPPPLPGAPAPAIVPMVLPTGDVRRITGSPLIWKKLRMPMLPNRVLRIIALAISLSLAAILYALIGSLGELDKSGVHAGFAVAYVLIAMVCTAVFAATSIGAEKETRTLPILLTTPMSDWHIIWACFLGVLRRSLPVWLFLAAHVAFFILAGFILHPIALLHLGMLAVWIVVFLTGAGLYFSACFKRTTSAVVMNLVFVLGIWTVLPLMMGLMDAGLSAVASSNPVAQAWLLTYGAGEWKGNMYGSRRWSMSGLPKREGIPERSASPGRRLSCSPSRSPTRRRDCCCSGGRK